MARRPVRWVIGITATLLLASAVGAGAGRPVRAADTVIRVYVGTYTGGASRGIYLLRFDKSSGSWVSVPVLAAAAEHPSWIALHPGGRYLYAVNEVETFRGEPTGAVSAFEADPASGHLKLLNQQPSHGTNPCHLSVNRSGRHVLVANYTSGTVAVLPVSGDGRLAPATAVRQGKGSGPVRRRQEGPHAHMILLDRSERFALWTDLGADRIHADRFDALRGRLDPADPDGVAIQAGSGPRHLAWHPSGLALYALNELSGTVSAFRFDAGRGVLETFQTVAARPAGATRQNTAAEIVMSPDGRFLYTSNRGDDTIAVFTVDAGSLRLTPVAHVPSGGRTPRTIAIDPSGRWLIAANQGSGSLVVFRRDGMTGLLSVAGSPVAIPDAVCILFSPSM